MPLDTSIPMQIAQVPQAQSLNPMALYQMMQERQAGALRNQLVQQEMLKNNMIMQNTMEDRRIAAATRAEAARKAAEDRARAAYLTGAIRGGYTPAKEAVMGPGTVQGSTPASFDEDRVLNALYAKGDPALLTSFSNMQEQFGKQREAQAKAVGQGLTNVKTQTETKGLDIKNVDSQLAQLNAGLERAASPEEVAALFNGSADAIRATGKTPEMSIAAFNQLASQIGFDAAKMQVAQGVMAVQKHISSLVTAQKPEIKNVSGTGMVTINPYTGEGKRVTIDGEPLSATASEVPELKKGERWNAEKQRVEAVPGSDIYIAQSQKHGKDVNAVNTVEAATKAALANIGKILDPKNEDAFNSNFGGSTYLGSRYQPGATQTIGAAIDSLKSTMKATGAQLMRSQGGAVGSITEREWPILEGMVASLSPTMPEQDAREVIANVRQRLANLNDISKETYDTTWGNTQYYKPSAGGAKSTAATDSKSVFDAADAILGGK